MCVYIHANIHPFSRKGACLMFENVTIMRYTMKCMLLNLSVPTCCIVFYFQTKHAREINQEIFTSQQARDG